MSSKFKLVFNFPDPATVWAYNLISVHHDIVWFIIIIMVAVYWSLYKILKDNGWNLFNKQSGWLKYIYYYEDYIIHIEAGIFFIWLRVFFFIFAWWYREVILDEYDETHLLDLIDMKGNFVERIFWLQLLDGVVYPGVVYPHWLFKISYEDSLKFFKDRYISYFLYSYTTNAFFYHERDVEFLKVHRFSNNLPLEYIFAAIPTFIVGSIIVPSLYLLYSLDEDLNPKYTIKVIGNQWFWTYEFLNLYEAHINNMYNNYKYYSYLRYTRFNNQYNAGVFNILEHVKSSNKYLPSELLNDTISFSSGLMSEFNEYKSEYFNYINHRWLMKHMILRDIFNNPIFTNDEILEKERLNKWVGLSTCALRVRDNYDSMRWAKRYITKTFCRYVIKELQFEQCNERKVKNIAFDSVLIQESDLAFGSKRLLEVDKRLILPINVSIRFLISSSDVLHSWAIPELGIKMDAVPGRLNQFITVICKPGVYYGQCSELCGVSHGFMPIVIQAISHDDFLEYMHISSIK